MSYSNVIRINEERENIKLNKKKKPNSKFINYNELSGFCKSEGLHLEHFMISNKIYKNPIYDINVFFYG